jgi:hypothetical protein
MKSFFLIALPIALMAQETPPVPAPAEQTAALSRPMGRSTILIEAKARAEDIMKAYDMMKKEKPTLRIAAHTENGPVLANIVDITIMPNGTWLLFRLSSSQGTKNQFVSVDDVIDLYYP